MARDWGLRVCFGGVACCSAVAGSSGFVDDQGSQEEEEEELDGVVGCGGGDCWVLDWEEDCASFRSMFMNMAISRSVELDSASAGGV
jgi:hypothetical protein